MERINIVPMPDKIEYLGGKFTVEACPLQTNIDPTLAKEEYILTADSNGISITGGSDQAVFYGKQTLRQMKGECPCVKISDKPAFEYRGFMLDCVRHIFSVDEIKKIVDAAASLKMNSFHWHLTDDQGFRAYSDRRPSATIDGSVRNRSEFGSLKENGAYGGYYTAKQMRDIVEYCAERYITVIPEFDVPGHCSALLHAYPSIGCTGMPVEIKTHQGIFEDILCAGKDETFEIVFDILEDLLEIFPSEYIHIGGDEAPKTRWKNCPDCQRRISQAGLANEEELQGWFTNEIVAFLKSKGRKAIVWNESLKSGLIGNDTVAQMWMDPKNHSVKFANNGGRIIVSDFFHYYCDYPYAMTPLNKTYKYKAVVRGIKNPCSVYGVEVPIWTEFINNFNRLCYMFFPRFAAVAETGWTKEENKNAADFCERFRCYSSILSQMGITAAPPHDWNPSPVARATGTVGFMNSNVRKKPKTK
ncbi:MAG: beta-N-acetylhexosaminidase [Clostridia bacterium]|nr:beta-N-acetylhexosaminidase [Clostridia bacterium]